MVPVNDAADITALWYSILQKSYEEASSVSSVFFCLLDIPQC
jgi:hypothetical protein